MTQMDMPDSGGASYVGSYQETATKELPVDAKRISTPIASLINSQRQDLMKDLMKPPQSIPQHLNYGEVL